MQGPHECLDEAGRLAACDDIDRQWTHWAVSDAVNDRQNVPGTIKRGLTGRICWVVYRIVLLPRRAVRCGGPAGLHGRRPWTSA
jgi:hypothetical protein